MTSPTIPPAVELPAEIAPYVEVLRVIEERRQKLNEYWEIAETHLKNALGNAEIGTVHGVEAVYWRHVKGKTTTDYKRLRLDHPEVIPLLQSYAKVGNPSRRFTLANAAAATKPKSASP
ncbi:hypothetical protein ACQPYK_49500 (plasmid) [Streptosporangium sp. CA-135522]|uniref:hypothetical protein n=1 Tax=Streptosporangium sp. CA-135522 TaxID=3240072 RepID=UPI003D8AD37A